MYTIYKKNHASEKVVYKLYKIQFTLFTVGLQ